MSGYVRKVGEYEELRNLNQYLENVSSQHSDFLLNQGQIAT